MAQSKMTFLCMEGSISYARDFLQETLTAWGFDGKKVNAVMLAYEQ